MTIGLLVDSTCDLDQRVIKEYKIELIPLSINFGETIFLDRVEISSREFFDRLEESDELPTTSQPSIGMFAEKYREMAEKYEAIISIHISSKLSGTVESAQLAANQLDRVPIAVIDSNSASLGLGFLALLAARLIRKGLDFDEIVNQIKAARAGVSVYFTVNNLDYLEKGGRIGKAQAFLGSILNLYPILSLPGEAGEVLPLEKVRGKNKVKKRMVDLSLEGLKNENCAWLGFLHGTNMELFNSFKEEFTEELKKRKSLDYLLDSNWVSPVLGCHVGPSVYGIAILKGDFLKL